MGDCLLTGKSSQCVPNSAFDLSGVLNRVPACLAGLRRMSSPVSGGRLAGNTVYDPIWQVTPRSSALVKRYEELYRLTFNPALTFRDGYS